MCDCIVTLTDEGVLFAKNSDRDPNEAQVVEWHAPAHHAPGATVTATQITIPQVARTHALLISRPWWIWGAEMGANDQGVVIGNEAVFTREPLKGPPGLLGMDLLRLALERAADAAAAADVIVTLLQEYGQAGAHSYDNPRFSYHNSFLIADPRGAIVLETAGRRWAAERVRGPARSISNGLTIPGFTRYADPLRSRVAQCSTRRHLTQTRAARAGGVGDLFNILRDNGTGGGPRWSVLNGSMVGPNMHAGGLLTSSHTASSWVSEVGAGRHWVTGTADPAFSLFLPLEVGRPATLGGPATNAYDPAAWWWRHEELRRAAARDWEASLAVVAAEREDIETRWRARPPAAPEAVAVAEAAYARWQEAIGEPADTRPPLVRRLWRRWDRAAGVPTST